MKIYKYHSQYTGSDLHQVLLLVEAISKLDSYYRLLFHGECERNDALVEIKNPTTVSYIDADGWYFTLSEPDGDISYAFRPSHQGVFTLEFSSLLDIRSKD